jgi:hypothetical protein
MGWTFKWRLVPLDLTRGSVSPNYSRHIPLTVNILPESGTHNLIHVTGQTVEKVERGLDPKIEAYGISGQIGYWRTEAQRTSSDFTTFCLSGTTNPGKIDWRWQKIEQSQNLRDPDLTYMFGFRFTFEEPFDLNPTGTGLADSLSDEIDDALAVEIILCDFCVTFEKTHRFFSSPVTLKDPHASWDTFRSDECDMPLEEVRPIEDIKHTGCTGCKTVPLPVSV